MSESIPCDIVVLPNDEIAEKAVKASQSLAPLGGLFTLEDGRFYPHSSLYMIQLKVADIDKAHDRLRIIAEQTASLPLQAVRYYNALGYLDVEYEATESLQNLQNIVLAAFNPIRDGMRVKDKARMLEAEGIALDNFRDYGYKYVGELFRPHITFTRFADEQPDARNLLPSFTEFNGTFNRIGLFEMGHNGTCVRKIAEYNLQGTSA